MWTICNGVDITPYVPHDSLQPDQTDDDQLPKAQFDVIDTGTQMFFDFGMEVIIWDENAPPETTIGGRSIPATPSHNLMVSLPNTTLYTTNGTLASLISSASYPPTMTFANSALGSGFLSFTTFTGYVHPGQSYMLTVYETTSPALVNANAILQMDFLDTAGNVIGGASVNDTRSASNLTNTQQKISIVGVAPTGAVNIKVSMGGQTTVAGTNSGKITFAAPQLEPMWFATTQGLVYPTPDINQAQVDCTVMPDGTISRTCRYFSGYIDDVQANDDGPNRTWHISVAGPGAQLENGLINAVFTSQYDSQILTTLVNTYFSGQLSISPPNQLSPAPVVQGALIDSMSFNDNSLRDALNSLIAQSGFVFFVDAYYSLHYQPAFYTSATFSLTDRNPDFITSFPYYEYQYHKDGTQTKRRIKINGGKFKGNLVQVFNGDGSTKQFNLTYYPDAMSVQIGTANQRVGVYGRDAFSSGSFDVLASKQLKYVLFNTAPVAGTNNVIVNYSYEAPVSTEVIAQSSNIPVAPAYVQPNFDSKVHDTNITSLTSATARGLAEMSKYGNPLLSLTAKAQKYTPAGTVIYFTSTPDNIINQPLVVQEVKMRYLGPGTNEFEYTLGSYIQTLIDHLRHANKASNRSNTVANVTQPQQIDVVAYETIYYRDSVSATPQPTYSPGVYGTGHYGSCAYGGSTGKYGTATYGQSTLYG